LTLRRTRTLRAGHCVCRARSFVMKHFSKWRVFSYLACLILASQSLKLHMPNEREDWSQLHNGQFIEHKFQQCTDMKDVTPSYTSQKLSLCGRNQEALGSHADGTIYYFPDVDSKYERIGWTLFKKEEPPKDAVSSHLKPLSSPKNHSWLNLWSDVASRYGGQLQSWLCDGPGETQDHRIGPFVTTGGYSWVQVSLDDFGRLSSILKKNGGELNLVEAVTTAYDTHGRTIGWPPLHYHHVHIHYGKPFGMRSGWACLQESIVSNKHENCYQEYSIYDIHSDRQCLPDEGGIGCLGLKIPAGYGIRIDRPLSVYADFNDVRRMESTPLEWYLQATFSWRQSDPKLKFLSRYTMNGWPTSYPGATFRVPREDSFHLDSFSFPFAGRLVHMSAHHHGTNVLEALLFDATPDELGFNGLPLSAEISAIPVRVLGMASSVGLRDFLLSRIEAAPPRNFATGVATRTSHVPSLKCRSLPRYENVSGSLYTRLPKSCCNPWKFKAHQTITRVILYSTIQEHQHEIMDTNDRGHHAEYIMFYESDDAVSRFSSAIATARGTEVDSDTWMLTHVR